MWVRVLMERPPVRCRAPAPSASARRPRLRRRRSRRSLGCVVRVMPPDASRRARPRLRRTASRIVSGVHVVQQDRLGSARERLVELVERVHLDLDRQRRLDARERPRSPAAMPPGDGDVVVLDQDRVVQARRGGSCRRRRQRPPCRAPQAGRRLAGVEHLGRRARPPPRRSCGWRWRCPTSAAAGSGPCARRSAAPASRPRMRAAVAGASATASPSAISTSHLGVRVEPAQHRERLRQAADDARLADDHGRLAAQALGHDRVGGQIAVADVLGQRAVDQTLDGCRAWQVVGVGRILGGVVEADVGAAALARGAARRTRSAATRRPGSTSGRSSSQSISSRRGRRRRAPGRRRATSGAAARPAARARGAGRARRRRRRRLVVEAGLDRAAREHEALEQRVRGQPVGAVHAASRALAAGVETAQAGSRRPGRSRCRPSGSGRRGRRAGGRGSGRARPGGALDQVGEAARGPPRRRGGRASGSSSRRSDSRALDGARDDVAGRQLAVGMLGRA